MSAPVIAMATCKNCGFMVRQEDWGNGGRIWKHDSSGKVYCEPNTHAQPQEGTVREP